MIWARKVLEKENITVLFRPSPHLCCKPLSLQAGHMHQCNNGDDDTKEEDVEEKEEEEEEEEEELI